VKEFKHLDRQAFEKYFSGFDRARSVGIYLKMSKLFLESFPENWKKLERYLREGDGSNAKILAHRLKGALRTVGGTRLAEVFFRIEEGEGKIPHPDLLKILSDHHEESRIFAEELQAWMHQLHGSLNGSAGGSLL